MPDEGIARGRAIWFRESRGTDFLEGFREVALVDLGGQRGEIGTEGSDGY